MRGLRRYTERLPITQGGQHIATFAQERARADIEREARMAAEARVRELEAELEQRQQG